MELTGKSAVVTGAASGIGLALARRLAALGAEVTLADIDGPAVARAAAEVGGQGVKVDVGSVEDNARLAELVPAPRVLCLNAGTVTQHAGPVWETPADDWSRVLRTNLGGVVNGLRAFVPDLLADGEPHSILITASLAGLLTWPGGGAYAASKHAVVAVAEQTALALEGSRVSVTVLCPGLVRTGMSADGADPDAVAEEALDAVTAGRFSVAPAEWSGAVRARGRMLAGGLQPRTPAPAG